MTAPGENNLWVPYGQKTEYLRCVGSAEAVHGKAAGVTGIAFDSGFGWPSHDPAFLRGRYQGIGIEAIHMEGIIKRPG